MKMASRGMRLHHVGYAVRVIEPAVEVYVARYGYVSCTRMIHDPVQTARVQFLRLAGDQTYLEFVAPDGPESKLAGAVKRGGGLNHLCYTCGPLENVIAGLEESGMRVLSAPMPGVAFGGRRICWMMGEDPMPVELVEQRDEMDLCEPGI